MFTSSVTRQYAVEAHARRIRDIEHEAYHFKKQINEKIKGLENKVHHLKRSNAALQAELKKISLQLNRLEKELADKKEEKNGTNTRSEKNRKKNR